MSYTPMMSGWAVDLLNPDADAVNLLDLSTGLARINRYLGQTPEPYSVAEHCVVMAEQAPVEVAIHFLLHDAHEYVTGDITHPLKQLLPGLKDIERGVQSAIYQALNIEEPDADLLALIHHYDMRMRSTEKVCFGIDPENEWPECKDAPAFPCRLPCWDEKTAAARFLELFSSLYADYVRSRRACDVNRHDLNFVGAVCSGSN